MSPRVSVQALNRLRDRSRADRVGVVEVHGVWHRVVAGSNCAGMYRLRCQPDAGQVLPRRTAVDMIEQDVCPDCRRAESEQHHE